MRSKKNRKRRNMRKRRKRRKLTWPADILAEVLCRAEEGLEALLSATRRPPINVVEGT